MKTINERANDLVKSIEREVRSDTIDEFIYKASLVVNNDVLNELIKIGDKMKKDIPTQEKDTSFCTAKESDFKFQIKQKVFYVFKGGADGYFYSPAFILSRKELIEHAYKDERCWRLDIDKTLSNTKQYNFYDLFVRFDTKYDKVTAAEEELCATEKEAIAREKMRQRKAEMFF